MRNIRFIIPYIPILGILLVMGAKEDRWINRDKYGNFSPVIDLGIKGTASAFVQAMSVFIIVMIVVMGVIKTC